MWYIYSESIETGRQEFVCTKDNPEEAVEAIRTCYERDARSAAFKDKYYYFMKKH